MKKILAVLIVLAILAGGFAVYRMVETDRIQREEAEAYEQALLAKVRPLRVQQNELENELARLEKRLKEARTHPGANSLLVPTPDRRIRDDAAPLMASYGWHGIVAVGTDWTAEGTDKLMNAEELRALCDEGWELSVRASGPEDIAAVAERLAGAGLPEPRSVYLRDASLERAVSDVIRGTEIGAIVLPDAAAGPETMTDDGILRVYGISMADLGRYEDIVYETYYSNAFVVTVYGYDEGDEKGMPDILPQALALAAELKMEAGVEIFDMEEARAFFSAWYDEKQAAQAAYDADDLRLKESIQEIKNTIDTMMAERE